MIALAGWCTKNGIRNRVILTFPNLNGGKSFILQQEQSKI